MVDWINQAPVYPVESYQDMMKYVRQIEDDLVELMDYVDSLKTNTNRDPVGDYMTILKHFMEIKPGTVKGNVFVYLITGRAAVLTKVSKTAKDGWFISDIVSSPRVSQALVVMFEHLLDQCTHLRLPAKISLFPLAEHLIGTYEHYGFVEDVSTRQTGIPWGEFILDASKSGLWEPLGQGWKFKRGKKTYATES